MRPGTVKHVLATRNAKSALLSAARVFARSLGNAEDALEAAAHEEPVLVRGAVNNAKAAVQLTEASSKKLERAALRFAELPPGRAPRRRRGGGK